MYLSVQVFLQMCSTQEQVMYSVLSNFMSIDVLPSEPRSRARLKRRSAAFDVGIEREPAIERERLKLVIESRVFRGAKK
jgi:hypothetical protein